MHPSPSSVCSIWPEKPVLPCVDPSVPQAIPAVCVRRTSISVQVLPFRLSLSPHVFTKVAEAALVPLREQGVRILNYLDDWLILAQSQDQRTQGFGALAPQPVGPSGQLGKEQTLADAEDLFSSMQRISFRSSAKTRICAAPAAYLYSRCDQRQLDAIIACQCALARLVYTRSGLVSLSDITIRRSSDVTSPFPPSGNEGYIHNWDVKREAHIVIGHYC